MPRLSHFSCSEGHQWELETSQSFEVDPAAINCPICGFQGVCRAASRFASEVEIEDELPPLPHRLMKGVSDALINELSSIGGAGDRSSVDPPQIAGYEILGELGRGGMGVVYHAKQVSLGRDVALKIVLAGAHAGWSERSRLRVEAETVACMKHPNIVPIYEVGEQDNLPYLALELVEGGSLAQALAIRPMASHQAAAMAETLAQAMSYVHERGVVHRDLKPANVLLTVDGVPKITDFGLAKWLDVPSGHTRSGVDPGHARIHGAGAGQGTDQSGRAGYRRLCARGDPLRDADGQAPVPRRHDAGDGAAVADGGPGTADPAPAARLP